MVRGAHDTCDSTVASGTDYIIKLCQLVFRFGVDSSHTYIKEIISAATFITASRYRCYQKECYQSRFEPRLIGYGLSVN